jgi:hypothetical protein
MGFNIHRLPGIMAGGLIILMTSLWTYWGMAEIYYEGWGLPFPQVLRYLTVATLFLVFSLLALTWPKIGGMAILIIGGAFSVFWAVTAARRGLLSSKWALHYLFPLSSFFVLVGALLLLEGRFLRRQDDQAHIPHKKSVIRRKFLHILAIGMPLLVALSTSIYYLPLIRSRQDSGERGACLVQGNGVRLIWAPKGPGWNWKQPWGGYPSWDQIALYGVPPAGLGDKPGFENRHATAKDIEETCICRYLSEDGRILMDEPQNIWRMPFTEEIVRSLVGGGYNAGCTWDRKSGKADCVRQPNKDSPLWAPDEEPIYYWSADEYDEKSAWYVPYTGGVRYGGVISHRPKDWGNPRHGYRCVREPQTHKEVHRQQGTDKNLHDSKKDSCVSCQYAYIFRCKNTGTDQRSLETRLIPVEAARVLLKNTTRICTVKAHR